MKTKFPILFLLFMSCSMIYAQKFSKQPSFIEQPVSKKTLPTLIEFEDNNAPVFSNKVNEVNQFLGMTSNSPATLMRAEPDEMGFTHYRYQQTLRGLPINEAVYVCHVKNDKLLVANGYWLNDEALEAIDRKAIDNLSEKSALKLALKHIKAKQYKWDIAEEEAYLKIETGNKNATYFPKGEKLFVKTTEEWNTEGVRLAWQFNVYAQKPLSRRLIYIDAENGNVLLETDQLHQADVVGTANTAYSGVKNITSSGSGTSYLLRETTRGKGINTLNLRNTTTYSATNFFSTSANWNLTTGKDQYALDAHFGAETTYDYFKNVHGRNSIDNAGFALNSYVHYGNNYVNAFWDGSRMTYGDGNTTVKPLTAMDVCGHEITHGLTERTANLTYSGESGALNEGFSDIFGTTIEFYSNPSTYAPNWTIGERMNYIIRNMANPKQYQQPSTYKGTYWSTSDPHIGSGVLNYWFYLVAVGGSGTNDFAYNYAIQGIGLDKAAKIAYRTLTVYLTASSTFANTRTASIQAAKDLYGSTSNEATQVTNAWCAVNVVCGNQAPSISITSPTANTSYPLNATVSIATSVSPGTGTITKVEFYQGLNTLVKIGEVTTAPYTFNWTNVPAGGYYLRAKATNSIGRTTTSNYVYIIVRSTALQGGTGNNTEGGNAFAGLTASSIGKAQLSPNPSHDKVNLDIPVADDGIYNVSVFNTIGSQVFSQQSYLVKGYYQQTLDISKWAKGLYLVHIQNKHENTVIKLIVD